MSCGLRCCWLAAVRACHKKGGWVSVGVRIYFNSVKPSQFGGCKTCGSRRVFSSITSGKNNNPPEIKRCGFFHRKNCANKFHFITETPRHEVKRKWKRNTLHILAAGVASCGSTFRPNVSNVQTNRSTTRVCCPWLLDFTDKLCRLRRHQRGWSLFISLLVSLTIFSSAESL